MNKIDRSFDLKVGAVLLAFIIVVSIVGCSIKSNREDTPVNATTAATTESTLETTIDILPTNEETIPVEPTETIYEPSEPPVTTVYISDVDPIERELMAIAVYQEAGGDNYCDDCRRRVADIVLNRVADPDFPDTIEDVLTQYAQYGSLWKTGIKWPDRAEDPYEIYAVERAYTIAEEVLKGYHSEVYGNGYVYQAEFVQGRDGFWHCGHWYGR